MKARKLYVVLLIVLIAAISVTAVACKKKTVTPGPETGVYYYDASDGSEYNITLSDGDKIQLSMKGETKSGKYKIDGTKFTVTFTGEEAFDAKYSNEEITISYGGVSNMKFLKKVEYIVSFDSDGGSAVPDVKVVNGRKISEPEEPTKSEHVFIGWYKNVERTQPFMFSTEAVTGNRTLYAKWEKIVEGDYEFTINFDLGNGSTMPSMQTKGGRLFNVPTPTNAGENFLGWWVSMFEDRTKLTYEFGKDTVFTEDTTLYAVWGEQGSLMPNVTATNIYWNSISSIMNYEVRIYNASGVEVAAELNNPRTTYAFNWSAQPAGEYRVVVTAGNITAERWYKNKALSRVSVFTVDNSVLNFNRVEGATNYLITIVCGNEDHEHIDLDIGNNTSYNFASCPQKEGGIDFVVKAVADGYLTSESRPFSYSRALDKVTLTVDQDNEVVSWDTVEFANNYIVSVVCSNPAHNHTDSSDNVFDNGKKTSYCYKECSGTVIINVYPKAAGYYSIVSSKTIEKTRLATPSNIKVVGTFISWDGAEDAKYGLKIGNNPEVEVIGTQHDIAELVSLTQGAEYKVAVKALGETSATDSLYSDEYTVKYKVMGSIEYANSTVTWDHVVGAVKYHVSVNGTLVAEVEGANYAKIDLGKAGDNTISVCFVDENGTESTASTCKAEAFEVTLEAVNGMFADGATTKKVYKAVGDDMTNLPEPTLKGNSFGGWYDIAGGASANGTLYTDLTFSEVGNITLYASYRARSGEVTLEYGVLADPNAGYTAQWPKFVKLTNGADYQLPVPASRDAKNAFLAWTTVEGDLTTRVTDDLGYSRKPWDITAFDGDVVLYAYFGEVLNFDAIKDSSGTTVGYSANKSIKDINKITTVTVPATYNGLPVTTIGTFSDAMSLEEINIPDTIRTISESAFDGCENLEKINIYTTGSTVPNDGRYLSSDGVLLKERTGTFTIEYIPAALNGEITLDNKDGIDIEIKGGLFAGRPITKLTIGKTVTAINDGAFSNCTLLEEVIFDDGGKKDLNVYQNVFSGCTALKSIELPERFKVSSYSEDDKTYFGQIFNGCSRLETVTIKNNNYIAARGVVYSVDERDGSLGTRLMFVPAAWTTGTNPDSTFAIDGIFELGPTVREIDPYAFIGNKTVNKIVINEEITAIGEYAFYGCSVTDVRIESTRIKTIKTNTFTYSSIQKFDMGDGVETVEASAFAETPLRVIIVGSAYKGYTNLSFNLSNIHTVFNLSQVKIENNSTGAEQNIGYYASEIYELESRDELVKEGDFVFFKTPDYTIKVQEDNKTVEKHMHGHVRIVDYVGKSKDVVIPAQIPAKEQFNEYTSYEIGYGAFISRKDITSVTLSDNLTIICDEAFYNCTNLTAVDFGKVETIGDNAFRGIGATALVFPETTKSIGSYAFTRVQSLTDVTLRGNNLMVGVGAFFYCLNLANVTIEDGVVGFDSNAFNYCINLSKVEFSDTVTRIGSYAFAGCDLKEVVIPGKVTSVGSDAFAENYGLEKLTLSEGLVYRYSTSASGTVTRTSPISRDAFEGCYNLVEVINYSELEPEEFAMYARHIVNVKQGDSDISYVHKIGNANDYYIFYENGNDVVLLGYSGDKTELVLPDSFNGKAYSINANAFAVDPNAPAGGHNGKIVSIVLPDGDGVNSGITGIGDRAFKNTLSLKSIVIPNSVAYIGEEAFRDCTSLEEVVIGNGVLVIHQNTFYGCTSIKSVIIGNSVKAIGRSAFSFCSSLQKLVIGESVEYIATDGDEQEVYTKYLPLSDGAGISNAFSWCPALREVYNLSSLDIVLGESNYGRVGEYATFIGDDYNNPADVVTDEEGFTYFIYKDEVFLIGYEGEDHALILPNSYKGKPYSIAPYAFYQNSNIISVSLSANVTAIGSYAFASTKVISVDILGNNLKYVGHSAFSRCDRLISINLPDSVEFIGNSAFYGCNMIGNINLARIEFVGDAAFFECTFPTVFIPNSVKYIGKEAFMRNGYLEEVIFEEGSQCESIGSYAFSDCTFLKTIDIPDSVKSILGFAFLRCSSLQRVNFGEDSQLESLGMDGLNDLGQSRVFQYCSALESIILPDSIKEIGPEVFDLCNSLKWVVIGKSLETIDNNAFTNNNPQLTDIFFNGAKKNWNGAAKYGTNITVYYYSAFKSNGCWYKASKDPVSYDNPPIKW